MSNDVLAVMDALKIQQADFMGYSMGAWLLGHHPGRLRIGKFNPHIRRCWQIPSGGCGCGVWHGSWWARVMVGAGNAVSLLRPMGSKP
jgi:hypothetical protein